ncbi:MAG: ATP-binding protein [Thermoplasmata archaeon]|nr:ATP-binding protein [Thermoplasmata archaeon]
MIPFLGQGAPAAGADAAHFQALFELATNGKFILDRERRVRRANPAAYRSFGAPGRELIGLPFAQLFTPASQAALDQAFARAVNPSNRPAPLAAEGLTLEGSPFPLEVIVSGSGVGAAAGFEVVVRDLQERAALLRALADRAEQFDRSHRDLREVEVAAAQFLEGPLRQLATQAQELARRLQGKLDRETGDFLTVAQESSARMEGIVAGLITFVQVDTRGQRFRMVSTQSCLDGVLQRVGPTLREAGATVGHGPLPDVEADPDQLGQVFQQLLVNAIKFRGTDAPNIQVLAQDQGKDVAFAVRDNGVGIGPEDQEKVFGLFHRLPYSSRAPGTGVGLALAKRIVERHGGRIWVESTGVAGAGSTVWFTLPKRQLVPESPPAARVAAPRTEEGFNLAGILVAHRLKELV